MLSMYLVLNTKKKEAVGWGGVTMCGISAIFLITNQQYRKLVVSSIREILYLYFLLSGSWSCFWPVSHSMFVSSLGEIGCWQDCNQVGAS